MSGTRAPMSTEQRAKLSAAQLAYIAHDTRWTEHRRKLAAAQEAKRMTLLASEMKVVIEMRKKGRTFSYIQEEIGVCHDVIRRELIAQGYSTERIKRERRVRKGHGHWRSFD